MAIGDPREADSSASASREASDLRRGPNAFPETYFGTTEGFPPGLSGGGMTGSCRGSAPGAGTVISGSTLVGGQITPSVASSFSASRARSHRARRRGSSGFIFSGMTLVGRRHVGRLRPPDGRLRDGCGTHRSKECGKPDKAYGRGSWFPSCSRGNGRDLAGFRCSPAGPSSGAPARCRDDRSASALDARGTTVPTDRPPRPASHPPNGLVHGAGGRPCGIPRERLEPSAPLRRSVPDDHGTSCSVRTRADAPRGEHRPRARMTDELGANYFRCCARCLFISNMVTFFLPKIGSSLSSARISRLFWGSAGCSS